jgi:hypothetical protein
LRFLASCKSTGRWTHLEIQSWKAACREIARNPPSLDKSGFRKLTFADSHIPKIPFLRHWDGTTSVSFFSEHPDEREGKNVHGCGSQKEHEDVEQYTVTSKYEYLADPSDRTQEDYGKDNPNVFLARIKSTGNTPARLVDSMVTYRQVSRLQDIPKEPDYAGRSSLNDLVLAKEDCIGAFAFLQPNQPNPIVTKDEALALRRREIFWYAYGIVAYLDTFGKTHETRFGYLYFFPLGGDPRSASLVREGLPSAYNKAT